MKLEQSNVSLEQLTNRMVTTRYIQRVGKTFSGYEFVTNSLFLFLFG